MLSLNDVHQQIPFYLYNDKESLVNLALVRHSLSEPALDLVWRHPRSLLPLLRLIPGFQKLDGQCILTGTACEWDWSRFDFYATKVKGLNLYKDMGVDLTSAICISRARATPLLPNLTSLAYGDIVSPRYPASIPLDPASPSLTHLNITANGQADSLLSSLLTILPTRAPNVRSISISDGISHSSRSHNILSSLQYFHNVRELQLSNFGTHISLRFLKDLVQENFTSISLNLDGSGVTVADEDLSGLNFIALRSLRLYGDSNILFKLIRSFDPRALEDLLLWTWIRNRDGGGVTQGSAASSLLQSAHQKWT
ncbi:hypothetical protein AX16_004280 [Volvariella volvacea WC 439]|nr:hypothetical protein AX16_004280 [Volvariella volvacea WC 439]